ncbi:hypothetical protein [Thermophilibacter mediterraneus]|uniref:hypothetical protein n=1 Tax=Thermophilibacter mediterraneus TaxID=1871031 RepID=UPI00093156A1|nr:hypothetical protein [Thermophilibacter mediterraneus]
MSLKLIASELGTTVDALIGDDAPKISRRADAEARRFLALYLASLTLFCLTTVMDLPSSFGGQAFTGPLWEYLRAVLLGAGLAITIPIWRLCVLSTRFEQNEHRNLSSLRTRRAQAF